MFIEPLFRRFVVSSTACLLAYSVSVQPASGAVKKKTNAPASAVELIYPDRADDKAEDAKRRAKLRKMLQDIARGSKINAVDKNGQSALMYAAALNERLAVCWLVAKGADVTLKSKKGKTAFELATDFPTRELLYECMRDAEPAKAKRTDYESNSLSFFTYNISSGIKPTDVPQIRGVSLRLVYFAKEPEHIAYLVRHGLDVNTRDSDGAPLLRVPAGNKPDRSPEYHDASAEVVQLLLALGLKAEEDTTRLAIALHTNDIPTLEKLLKQMKATAATALSPAGKPIIKLARSAAAVRALTAAGVNAKETWKSYNTPGCYYEAELDPISCAVRKGAPAEVVQALLEVGAPLNDNLLALAQDAAMAETLIKAGQNVNESNKIGAPNGLPLVAAAEEGRVDVVKTLLSHGAKPNGNAFEHPVPKALARRKRDRSNLPTVLTMLIEAGANQLNLRDAFDGFTNNQYFNQNVRDCMTPAQRKADVEIIRTLLKHKVWDAAALYGMHSATEATDIETYNEIVTLLLDSGVNPASTQGSHDPAYTNLFRTGACDAAIAKRMIDAGVDPKSVDERGWTALFEARSAGVVKLLLEAGLSVDARDKNGLTPLHRAHTPEVAEALIKAGADVNAQDADGNTPLMAYCSRGWSDPGSRISDTPHAAATVEVLLRHKAKTDIRNKQGKTALDLAKDAKLNSLITLLEKEA